MIVLVFFFYNRSLGSEINIYHINIKRKFSLLYTVCNICKYGVAALLQDPVCYVTDLLLGGACVFWKWSWWLMILGSDGFIISCLVCTFDIVELISYQSKYLINCYCSYYLYLMDKLLLKFQTLGILYFALSVSKNLQMCNINICEKLLFNTDQLPKPSNHSWKITHGCSLLSFVNLFFESVTLRAKAIFLRLIL